ncbi:MAG: Uma2 family endonuclease [Rhizonema sp. PD37]|nr:Uma2 family endonuclease [Rhizonema sp. PD37]
MAQASPKLVTFDEFIAWYPDNVQRQYELHNGVIIEMPLPIGDHEEITGFLARKLTVEFDRLDFPYFIPKVALVKPPKNESGYSPDVLIVNRSNLINEPLWKKESTLTQSASIPLVVEVVSQCVARVPRVEATEEPVRVSTNWRDDYGYKLIDYEALGIPEYWIVDYLALGGSRYIGKPKQPTISIYSLIEDEYQVTQFRGTERIQSRIFPELTLNAQQIFQAGNQ